MGIIKDEKKHKNMSAVKNKGTDIEILLRRALWKAGIRYRKNLKTLDGNPDIVLTKYKIAIFCDGDFWHGRNFNNLEIKTNPAFWYNKIRSNMERDLDVTMKLRDDGWVVLRFWKDEIKKNTDKCVNIVKNAIGLRNKKIVKKY